MHHHVVRLCKRGKLRIRFEAIRHRKIAARLHVVRILRRKRLFLPKVKRKGAAKGHEEHRGKDADRRKARSVLPHAVEHARDRNEVLRFVIEPLVGAQCPQHRDAAGSKKQVCCEDHEQHQDEEDSHCRSGFFHRPRIIICSAEHPGADERHGDDEFGILFTTLLALQKLDGVGKMHLRKVVKRAYEIHAKEKR